MWPPLVFPPRTVLRERSVSAMRETHSQAVTALGERGKGGKGETFAGGNAVPLLPFPSLSGCLSRAVAAISYNCLLIHLDTL